MTDSLWYPSVDDVLEIHEDIVSEYPDTSSGVKNRGDIEFALEYISEGNFGSVPETIHEKTFHFIRLIVANHPFVDGKSAPRSTRRLCSICSMGIDSNTTTRSGRY